MSVWSVFSFVISKLKVIFCLLLQLFHPWMQLANRFCSKHLKIILSDIGEIIMCSLDIFFSMLFEHDLQLYKYMYISFCCVIDLSDNEVDFSDINGSYGH